MIESSRLDCVSCKDINKRLFSGDFVKNCCQMSHNCRSFQMSLKHLLSEHNYEYSIPQSTSSVGKTSATVFVIEMNWKNTICSFSSHIFYQKLAHKKLVLGQPAR